MLDNVQDNDVKNKNIEIFENVPKELDDKKLKALENSGNLIDIDDFESLDTKENNLIKVDELMSLEA
ncbi:unnamed protein product [Rhizopus stolonifer]